ncbi:alanine racemase, N-terminal domain protein [Bordetella holmesii ATCC 51541]|nr:alanine racemase, N-terminal domain protein [Bordetella holmesii ATCC 51541]
MSINVFVYGTLRSGEINDLNHVAARHGLPQPRALGQGRVPGYLVDFGDWPGLVPVADGRWVMGDIYQIDPQLLPLLDHIEDVGAPGGSCFMRTEIAVQTTQGPIRCQYYPVDPAHLQDAPGITDDDWVSYRAARQAAAVDALETPALLLDIDRLHANTAMMRARAAALGVTLRPHVKTAKCIEVALAAGDGRTGPITVSTLKEADQFFAAGFTDILYAVGITPNKLDHVGRLRRAGCDLKIILDNRIAAEAVCEARSRLGLDLPCLLEIDCDGHRSGLKPDDPELLIIADILRVGGVTLAGVLTHAGNPITAAAAKPSWRWPSKNGPPACTRHNACAPRAMPAPSSAWAPPPRPGMRTSSMASPSYAPGCICSLIWSWPGSAPAPSTRSRCRFW